MIISTNVEKSFDKIQHHPFTIKKNTQRTRNRREYPQPDKEHLQKPKANIILNAERLKLSSYVQGQDKDVHSCHFYSTMH